MPTDLEPVSARKRAEQEAQGQTDITILLLFVIFALVVMLLLPIFY